MRIVICDLDGTLALTEHRQHYVTGEKKDWDSFFKACVDDQPNFPIIELVNDLYGLGYRVEIVSGRSDLVLHETLDWLAKFKVSFHGLTMREKGNHEPDSDFKLKILRDNFDKDSIFLVLDDRQSVVDMWRSEGLTCLQVAPGDF